MPDSSYQIPIFPASRIREGSSLLLAADIGATKTEVALYRIDGNSLDLVEEDKLPSTDYKSLEDLLDRFLTGKSKPDIISLGVAGPVIKGKAFLTNLHWNIDADALKKHFALPLVILLNDLEATAYGVASLPAENFSVIHQGDDSVGGNMAIIAPGTGLGEAGLYWDESYYHPFATEGGHSDFSPLTSDEFNLLQYLQKSFGHVSWERLLSGQGIVNIFTFLRDVKKMDSPDWLEKKMKEEDPAAVISHFVNIKDECAICREAMKLFFRFLARESANLVLKQKSTGGLIIAGGIINKIHSQLQPKEFMSDFLQMGRLNSLLEKVPVKMVLNEKTALLGAVLYGRYQASTKPE